MPATERYQVDWFAIIVLIATILIIVFLIIVAIYFYNLMNLKPPSRGESTFLFWTTVILAIIFLIIAIFALVHIFTYKSIVYEEPSPTFLQPAVTYTSPPPVPITSSTSIRMSNVPKFTPRSSLSTSFSDPVRGSEETPLKSELLSIESAMSDA